MREKYIAQLELLKRDLSLLHNTSRKNIEIIKTLVSNNSKVKVTHELKKAREVDSNIRTLSEQIEHTCIKLISLQQPLASDLRFIISVLKNTTDFSRISRDSLHSIEELSAIQVTREYQKKLETMVDTALKMMDVLFKAMNTMTANISISEELSHKDTTIDKLYEEIVLSLLNNNNMPLQTILSLNNLARHLERVGDHICNIAERWYYTITGKKIVIK